MVWESTQHNSGWQLCPPACWYSLLLSQIALQWWPHWASEAKVFFILGNMPNTIAVIDCTQMYIQASHEREWEYVNRKGKHSINVQLVQTLLSPTVLWDCLGQSMDLQEVPIVHRVPNQQAGWNNIRWQCLPTPTMGDDTFSHTRHSLTDALQQCPWKNNVCQLRAWMGVLKRRSACLNYLRVLSMQHNTGLYCATQYRYPTQCPPLWHWWSSRAPCSCWWSRPTFGFFSKWETVVVQCEMLLSTITFEGWSQIIDLCLLKNIFV